METETVPESTVRELQMPRGEVRLKSDGVWIDDHGSGTLRKAKRLGFAWRALYLEERTAHEWGWEFRATTRSRVSFGDAFIEGDTPALTEACWHIERYLSLNPFPDSDKFEAKYIYCTDEGTTVEGVGIVVRQTSATWLPSGHIVFCIIARYNTHTKEWERARNPF